MDSGAADRYLCEGIKWPLGPGYDSASTLWLWSHSACKHTSALCNYLFHMGASYKICVTSLERSFDDDLWWCLFHFYFTPTFNQSAFNQCINRGSALLAFWRTTCKSICVGWPPVLPAVGADIDTDGYLCVTANQDYDRFSWVTHWITKL